MVVWAGCTRLPVDTNLCRWIQGKPCKVPKSRSNSAVMSYAGYITALAMLLHGMCVAQDIEIRADLLVPNIQVDSMDALFAHEWKLKGRIKKWLFFQKLVEPRLEAMYEFRPTGYVTRIRKGASDLRMTLIMDRKGRTAYYQPGSDQMEYERLRFVHAEANVLIVCMERPIRRKRSVEWSVITKKRYLLLQRE
jgi:hypothetical protein